MPIFNPSIDCIVNLATEQVPNDNSPRPFFYDQMPTSPFSVPKNLAFVVTDIVVNPEITQFSSNDFFMVVVSIDGGRTVTIRSDGRSVHMPLSTGLIAPGAGVPGLGGKSVDVRNTTFSTGPVQVQLMGYFVRSCFELGVGRVFAGGVFP